MLNTLGSAECRPSGGREINPFRDGKPAHTRKRPVALKTRKSPRCQPGKTHAPENMWILCQCRSIQFSRSHVHPFSPGRTRLFRGLGGWGLSYGAHDPKGQRSVRPKPPFAQSPVSRCAWDGTIPHGGKRWIGRWGAWRIS